MFAKTTPEASSGVTNVKKKAPHQLRDMQYTRLMIGLAGEMVMDRKGAFRALYREERTDVFADMAPETLTHTIHTAQERSC